MPHAPDTRSARKQKLREAHKRFLNELVDRTGKTLTALAREADLDQSALTRFMNDEKRGSTLDTLTIATLVEKTGVRSVVVYGDGEPREASAGFRESEAEQYIGPPDDPLAPAIAALTGRHLHLVPWVLKSPALQYEGYMPGDIMIVDLNAEPEPGKVVCVQIYDWQNRAKPADTVFRLYQPPFLLAAGPTPDARQPRLVTDGAVMIKGLVRATLRPR